MSTIDLKDIDYFLAVVKLGSISKASEELYISQPALTKYIRNLESRLNIQLFYHDRRPLSLTPAGKLYYNYAKDISLIKSNLEAELRQIDENRYDDLRIGFACTGLRKCICDGVTALRSSSPKIRVTLLELTSSEVEQQLLSGKLDLGFVTFPTRSPGFATQFILEENILLAVPKSHPLSHMGTPCYSKEFPTISLEYFQKDPFILRDLGTRFRERTDLLFSMANFVPKVALTARNNFSAMEFAESLKLCTLTTKSFIRNLENMDSMRFFVAGPCPQNLYSGLIYKKSHALSLPACQLLNFITDIVSQTT